MVILNLTPLFLCFCSVASLMIAIKGYFSREQPLHLWAFFSALLLFGFACLIVNAIAGSHINQNGVLNEYFALIPIGFGCLFFGTACVFILSMLNRFRQPSGPAAGC